MERLGWTLLHFLWQGVAIAILYAAARRVVRHHCQLACALAAMSAAPVITWFVLGAPSVGVDAPLRLPAAIPASSAAAVVSSTWGTMLDIMAM
ncbi:MAG TPA: hypothetical protein VKU19_20230 [Bryobacteraceae bacterium]|nr:hypothetical protein [Bryobacteraceae bacterium]